jgi:murein DD-endopeptidase MepM/ murein hydrolase activator NlpD
MKEKIIQFGKRQKFRALRALNFVVYSLSQMIALKRPVLKERHIKAPNGHLRVRYSFVAIALAVLTTYVMASANWNQSVTLVNVTASQQTSDVKHMDVEGLRDFAASKGLNTVEPASGMAAIGNAILPPLDVAPKIELPKEWSKKVAMEKGGTLGGLLEKNDVGAGDAFKIVKAMGKYVDPRDLKPGQHVVIHYARDEADEKIFKGMDVIKSGIETVEIRREEGEYGFKAVVQKEDLYTETRSARVTVTSSIYANLAAADVPDGIINQFIRALSWSIDFQRDIWGGEEIEVLYTVRKTKDESYLRSDELLFANFISKGQKKPIYLFTKKDGDQDYFDNKGRSVRKALLKTPVDGARISSGYGMRKHPVLGYSKMHKGLDFAAPTGTPIYAAGKGVVEKAEWFSSFGRYIRIRHNNKYKTAYAHLHKIAKGVKKGARVKQGQVIGYVGSTGRSTGPHLHYEVHVNGKQVNPRSMKLPIGETLSGTNLANFKIRRDNLDKKFEAYLSAPSKLVKISAN